MPQVHLNDNGQIDAHGDLHSLIGFVNDGKYDNIASSNAEPERELMSSNFLLAVEKFRTMELQETEHKMLLEGLHESVHDFIRFVRAVAGGFYVGFESGEYLKCIVSIFDFSFISVLIDLRQKFIMSALEEVDLDHEDQTIICWIDIFFTYFTDIVSIVAGGQRKAGNLASSIPKSLQKQKQEESLRVACQLPQMGDRLPDILQSQHASPAVKRLSLAVLFAAFVVRPDIEDCDPWLESRIGPCQILRCMQALLGEFIVQARSISLSGNDPVSCELRTAYAMLIALYASTESSIRIPRKDRTDEQGSYFKPHTMASLLELMHLILFPVGSADAFIFEGLDDPQNILLQWGCTVPWAWAKWDDPRVLQFEAATKLAANWFCHLDKSIWTTLWEDRQSSIVSGGLSLVLRSAIGLNPNASLIALFHQINNAKSNSKAATPERIMCIFYRATWCLAELIITFGGVLASENLSLVIRQVIELFVTLSLGTNRVSMNIRKEIIRTLDAVDQDAAGRAFTLLQEKTVFATSMAEAKPHGKGQHDFDLRKMKTIDMDSSMVAGDKSGQQLSALENSLNVAVILDFISFICKSDAAECLPVTTSAFMSDVTRYLSSYFGYAVDLRIALLRCLTSVHARCRSRKPPSSADTKTASNGELYKSWDDEDAYNLALSMNGVDLKLASAFSSYVALTIKKGTDPLLVAEVWDYLRDVLIVLATSAYDDEQLDESPDPLALVLTAEKICQCLGVLLERCNTEITSFLLKSPMTFSLIDALQKAVVSPPFTFFVRTHADSEKADERLERVWKEFLRKVGGSLLETDMHGG
ncbi:hypothetical protein M0805_004780 [Coniferiporia weirii]|nr:hypothetical protein M0805_004780 [Coniferiporia weirii]